MFNDTERLATKDILSMLTEPVNRLDRGLCAFYKVSVGAARRRHRYLNSQRSY